MIVSDFDISVIQRVFADNNNKLTFSLARLVRAIFTLSLIVTLAASCAVPGQHGPGIKHSVTQVIRDPNIWAPLLTAALLQVDDLDHKISDRLREDTPLFGSTQYASEASDNFRDLTEVAYISTALLTPGPPATGDWISNKAVLLGTESLIVGMAQMATSEIKSTTGRERPSNRDTKSFVSGHTSAASAQSQMAVMNVENLQMKANSKQALNFTFSSLAALTAWARVEAGEHYPSDVLAGWALGHFTSNIGREIIDPDHLQVVIRPRTTPDASGIELIIRF